ncbi:hypothetical protein GCM10009839_87470 [Catenulispora yoronensis]|uniref:Uncharacterized protein n=1 Tax=Catenulispora yoronensis TaxID=450799 RepID=A0ABN2VI66_9ACTN
MRYLIESFAVGALRRGSSVEQFLGVVEGSAVPSVRWVEVVPQAGGFVAMLHESEDIGNERFFDLVEFPNFPGPDGEECFGIEVGIADQALDALDLAEAVTGAVRQRWVNAGVAQDEYRDFVLAGRPAQWPSES